jgi:hypothetical protein
MPLVFSRWDMYQRTLRDSPNDYYAEASKYWLRTLGEAANPARSMRFCLAELVEPRTAMNFQVAPDTINQAFSRYRLPA